jgi:hypothetical protein
MRRLLIAATAFASVGITTHAYATNAWDRATLYLTEGENERAVISAFGPPASVTVQTCGTKINAPWNCRIYRYDARPNSSGQHDQLMILFSQTANGWVVDSWNTFDRQ